MNAAETAATVRAMPQIGAASHLLEFEQTHADELVSLVLAELDDTERRKHVRTTMDRIARRMGFEDCADLAGNLEDPRDPELPIGQPVDLSDLDLSSREGWLEARKRAATVRHTRPDFATVDWDACPTYDRTPATITCPRCGKRAEGSVSIGALFGTRKSKTFSADLGPHRIETHQSLCRECRTAHKRARKAAKG